MRGLDKKDLTMKEQEELKAIIVELVDPLMTFVVDLPSQRGKICSL